MLFNGEKLKARYNLASAKKASAGLESNKVICEGVAFDQAITYDIFLSNRFVDKEKVAGLAITLREDFGLSVYVDWEDSLDRNSVNKETAAVIRDRMSSCKCLWYVASLNAGASNWMPWEAGYMDGKTGRVAICPISDVDMGDTFNRKEYLSLYPFVSRSKSVKGNDTIWINEDRERYIAFDEWLKGGNPHIHN